MGAFDDTANYWTNHPAFTAMLNDLRAHGLNSELFVNGRTSDNLPLASIADSLDFPIITSWFHSDLAERWWPSSVTADAATAESVIGPLVDQLKAHPSIQGYNIKDDASTPYNEKMRLAANVFRAHDPSHPASPTMVWGSLGKSVYDYVQPDVFLMYYYPATIGTTACSWAADYVNTIEQTTSSSTVPLWLVLQAHQTSTGPGDTDPSHLRYMSVEEERLQTWEALGLAPRGLWYFQYDDNPEWLGFKNQPSIYAEIQSLASRTASLPFGLLSRAASHFLVDSGNFARTLSDGTNWYAVIANTSCSARTVTVSSDLAGHLQDVETGMLYNELSPIPMRGGDGKLLRLVP